MAVVWRMAAATALIVLAFAMSAPVLAISLRQAGHSSATVGAFAMIPFLLIGVLIPAVPTVLARFGVVRTYRTGCLLQLLGAGGYALGDGLLAWSAASMLSGAGAAALWNATEALLAREAPAAQRGRVMGLYQTGLGAALAVGPFAPAAFGWTAPTVFWAAWVLVAGCCVMAWTLPRHATPEPAAHEHEHASTWRAMRAVPLLAVIAFCGGVFEAGLTSLSAAQASSMGLDLGAAATVAGAIGVGSFACQYPAGLAADRFGPRAVFSGAAVLLLLASAMFVLAQWSLWVMWAVGWVWGGVGGALYTLSMIQVSHHFAGRATAPGAAAMITGYTMGGALGPVANGAALQWFGTPGMATLLCALAVATWYAARRVPR